PTDIYTLSLHDALPIWLMINSYKVFRGTAPGNETLLTTVAGMQTGGSYDDTLASNDTQTYYYKVVAVNSSGESCPNNEVAVPWVDRKSTRLNSSHDQIS